MINTFEINETYFKLSKEEVNQIFKKPATYIFGKNGAGKTTLSRNLAKYASPKTNLFLFNEDYVQKNVFVHAHDEDQNNITKRNSKNDKNSFKIFFGEILVNIEKEVEKTDEEIRKNLESANKLIDNVDEKYKNEYCFETTLTETKIDKKFLKKIGSLQEKEEKEIAELISLDKNNKSFNKIIIENNQIHELIDELNKKIEELNKILFRQSKNKTVYDIHEIASNSPEQEIEWLGKNYKKEIIQEWFKNFSKEKHKFRKNIEDNIETIKNNIKNILNNDNLLIMQNILEYKNITNNLTIFSNEVINYEISLELPRKNKIFSLEWNVFVPITSKDIKGEIEIFTKENRYKIIANPSEFEKLVKYLFSLKQRKIELNEKRKIEERKIEEFTIKRINSHLTFFGFNDLKIDFISSGINTKETFLKMRLNDNKSIENLSEGEKKMIAFSYFLADLEINVLNPSYDKIIIFIDDPFDSNDHYKYSNLPNVEFKIRNLDTSEPIKGLNKLRQEIKSKLGKELNLIISTHNLGVYFSFFINIRENSPQLSNTFSEIKPLCEEEISLLELKKGENNIAKFSILNHAHFFPLETNMKLKLKLLFLNIFNMNGEELNKINILRIIALMLIKLNDDGNIEERNFYKNFIYGEWIYPKDKNGNKPITSPKIITLEKIIEKLNKDHLIVKQNEQYNQFLSKLHEKNNDINSNINSVDFKKLKEDNEYEFEKLWNTENDLNIFMEYFNKFSEKLKEVLMQRNDPNYSETFKRLRHKNNIHYNAIGFALEE